jgi:DNA topoisomerase VI subunit A
MIFILVDFDPDGIAILRNYKYGSQSLRHEKNITTPRAKWLGIKSYDIIGNREGFKWNEAEDYGDDNLEKTGLFIL